MLAGVAALIAAPVSGAGAAAVPGTIGTAVGGPGIGKPRNVAQVPISVAVGPGGTVLVGDANDSVRAFGGSPLWERVVAGTGVPGFSGDRRPAVKAAIGPVTGLAVDVSGDVIIADPASHRVRVVAAVTGQRYGQVVRPGDIFTVAGGGEHTTDGVAGHRAALAGPAAVAADPAGNVLIADGNRIRVVAAADGTFYGQAMTAGDIYTVAGAVSGGTTGDGGPAAAAHIAPAGIAVDAAGNLVLTDQPSNRVRVVAVADGTFYGQAMTAGDMYTVAGVGGAGFTGDGGPALDAKLTLPQGITVDPAGNLVLPQVLSGRVRVVAATDGTFYGQVMAAGDIYTVAGDGVFGFSGDGGPATAAQLDGSQGVATDAAGNLIIGDAGNGRIRVVAGADGTFYGQVMIAGDIYSLAGNGRSGVSGNRGRALNAELAAPAGVTVDAAGDYVIRDHAQVRFVPTVSGCYFGQAMTAGYIYPLAGTGHDGYSGDGGPALAARLGHLGGGLVLGPAGSLLMADPSYNAVRMIAAVSGTYYGQPMTAGDIYTVAGTGNQDPGYSGDGGPATAAQLAGPLGVATDAAGNLIIADRGNERIRVVAAADGTFFGQAMTAGDIYTVAGKGLYGSIGNGKPALSATVLEPVGVTVDPAGNLIIAETYRNQIRVVAESDGTFYGLAMTSGNIYTVAGRIDRGFGGDGGPAPAALLSKPWAVAVDAAGNIVIADRKNSRIRVVAGSDGTFYGQSMTTGDIYTVAGNGLPGNLQPGFAGDGGPATGAELFLPQAVTTAPDGSLVIADTGNHRIRVVTG